ncbi:MAG: hypothetical protein HY043_00915 [Verrucomicrobia bacterium]|nr:hypothetical protein [Verrucomicrobiota bacterium]
MKLLFPIARKFLAVVIMAVSFTALALSLTSNVFAAESHAEPAAQATSAAVDHGASATHDEVPVSAVKQFAYSYLVAFMFFLSLVLGSLFLVIIHHLFDSNWSVPIRRFLEHIACLSFPWMAILFVPIAVLAKTIYPWMSLDPAEDHALHAKAALFNMPAFYVVSSVLFLLWGWLSHGLRRESLAQDKTGAASHTKAMRRYAAGGIFIFAFSMTLAAIYWVKALEHQWFSTMYGVYYFAGSVWTTLATAYVITYWLKQTGPLRDVARERQFHDIGVLLLAFTVFYAYIHFSQYFLIWNAAVPEETFWYVKREKGSWWGIGLVIVFGHFLVPFLSLLRIDAKKNISLMAPIAIWAWLMHYCDMQFNIMPVIHPNGVAIGIFDVLCFAGIGWLLFTLFKNSFAAHPPYPQKDPRWAETLGVYVPATGAHAASHGGGK